jgi:hypothetical protein
MLAIAEMCMLILEMSMHISKIDGANAGDA